jgi:paraquat-inducible protein B
VNQRPYRHSLEYVVQFSQSVRGLRPGAPVEYRGIQIGRVERVLLTELMAQGMTGKGQPIPVLIRLEPGRIELPDSEEGTETLARAIETSVANGLRASLSTGSLLTGSLYVTFEAYRDEPPAEMGSFAGRPTIPTIATGLEGIQLRVSALLDKLNALPLDKVLDGVDRLLANVDAIVASEDTQSIPASLEATLAELDRTLESLRNLSETLEEQPNALIFNREPGEDPEPPAGPQ